MLHSVIVGGYGLTKVKKRRSVSGLSVLAFTLLAVVSLGFTWRDVPGSASVQETLQSAWQSAINAARGPVRVGIQIGHENVAAHPEELAQLRWNTGGHANGLDEVELNRAVAGALQDQLEAYGVVVELLSATPPEGYYADLVLSLHADSVEDPARRGYKSAYFDPKRNPLEPRLKATIDRAYLTASGFPDDHHNTTQNMHRYYAFNTWRYRHSVHPGTPALIIEMGYLSSDADMAFLSLPEQPAAALSAGILEFLQAQGRLPAELVKVE